MVPATPTASILSRKLMKSLMVRRLPKQACLLPELALDVPFILTSAKFLLQVVASMKMKLLEAVRDILWLKTNGRDYQN